METLSDIEESVASGLPKGATVKELSWLSILLAGLLGVALWGLILAIIFWPR